MGAYTWFSLYHGQVKLFYAFKRFVSRELELFVLKLEMRDV